MAAGDIQASVRAVTGTALSYEGDWHALFDLSGIGAGDFNGRLLAWINLRLGSAYTEINGAMAAFALANGAGTFQGLGPFDASISPPGATFDFNPRAGRYAMRSYAQSLDFNPAAGSYYLGSAALASYTSIAALIAAQGGTFTRASGAYYLDSGGVWQLAAADVARERDYSAPSGVPGFRRESARTNSVRNNSMQGAAAGTPGSLPTNWSGPAVAGIVTQVVGTGVENGIDYVDIRYSGTTADAGWTTSQGLVSFDTLTNTAAASGQTWAASVFMKLVAGSFPSGFQAALDPCERASGGGLSKSNATPITIPSAGTLGASRLGAVALLSGGAGTACIQSLVRAGLASPTAGISADFTIRIGWPQLEQGAFASSPIRTTGAAATRAADLLTLPTTGWLNPAGGAIYAEFEIAGRGASQGVFGLSDGTDNNTVRDTFNDTTLISRIKVGGVDQALMTLADAASGVKKIATRYAVNDFAASFNGGPVQSDTAGSVPTGLTTLDVGTGANQPLDGWLRRLRYHPLGNAGTTDADLVAG